MLVNGGALFVFLAACVVSVFAFLSVAVWSSVPGQERLARERLALLRSLAEQQGENAALVLQMMREEDQRRAERAERRERQGFLSGGLIVMAVGAGLTIMLGVLSGIGSSTIGLIPLLVGCALCVIGLSRKQPRRG